MTPGVCGGGKYEKTGVWGEGQGERQKVKPSLFVWLVFTVNEMKEDHLLKVS